MLHQYLELAGTTSLPHLLITIVRTVILKLTHQNLWVKYLKLACYILVLPSHMATDKCTLISDAVGSTYSLR